jgi:YD repeat-containing protein
VSRFLVFAAILAAAAPQTRQSDCARDELLGPVHTVVATIQSLERDSSGNIDPSQRPAWTDMYDRSCTLVEHKYYTTDFINDQHPQRTDPTTVVLHSTMGDRTVHERYDESGLLVETRTTTLSGELIDDSRNTYDAAGRVTRVDSFDADGKHLDTTTFTRDANGHVIREAIDFSDGRSYVQLSRYEFDHHGNWVKKFDSSNDPEKRDSKIEPSDIVFRAITYYDENGG